MLSRLIKEKILAILEHRNIVEYEGNIIRYPQNSLEISQLLKAANRFKFKINCLGMGTNYLASSSQNQPSLILSTQGLNKVLDIDEKNLFIRVESGFKVSKFINLVNQKNYYFPLQLPEQIQGSMGGLFATLRPFTVVGTYLKGIELLLPNGDYVRYGCKTLKNVSGYNLCTLFSGSFGKLGIITNLLLKISSDEALYYEKEKYEELRLPELPDHQDPVYLRLKQLLDPNNVLNPD